MRTHINNKVETDLQKVITNTWRNYNSPVFNLLINSLGNVLIKKLKKCRTAFKR